MGAKPSSDFHVILQKNLSPIVNFVAGADPDKFLSHLARHNMDPVLHRGVLYPAHIDYIIDMAQLINIAGFWLAMGDAGCFK